jgi:DNA repair exonuclease SbcCD ATPase subunit
VLLSRIPQLNTVPPHKQGAGLRNGGKADEWEKEWKIKFEKEWAKKRSDLDAKLLQDAKDFYMRMVKELSNELRVLEAKVNKIKLEYEALAQKATPAELAEAHAKANTYMVNVIKDSIKEIKQKESKFKFDATIPEGTSAYYRELAKLASHTKSIMSTKILQDRSYYASLLGHLEIVFK